MPPRQLVEIADVVMGQSPLGETCNNRREGLPLLNGPTEFGPHHPRPVQFTTDARKCARAGDLLFCVRGSTTGRMNWADQEYAIGRGIAAIRHRRGSQFYPFIRGVIESQLSVLLQAATGSTFPNVSAKQLSEISIPDLSEFEQLGISKLIGTIDDKIDLNRRMNETLEAMAWAIFKDWFVDFGPVRAKAEGRPPYFTPDLWALFPHALDDEDKPVGWNYEPLDKVALFLNGLALQKYPPESHEFLPVIKIAELRSGITDKSSKASLNIPSQYIVEDGDVLFSWSGSLTHLVWTNGKGALNQHLFKVNSDLYPKWFFYYWIEQHMPIFQAVAESKATTMGHIQRHHITEALTIIPNKPVLEAANELIAPLFERTIANNLENRTLAQLRDLLLPKLMSGEIRLWDAEKVVEAVA